MSKAINIKVSKDRLLDALRARLSEVENTQLKYLKSVETFEKEQENYIATARKVILKTPELITEVSKSHYWSNDTHVKFSLEAVVPRSLLNLEMEEPKKPFSSRGYGRNYVSGDYEDIVAEITNAIRLLELSDEDVVSTATYASVSRYL